MIKVYTEEEYNQAKYNTLLKLRCKHCETIFERQKKFIKCVIIGHSNGTLSFCSNSCAWRNKITSSEFICEICSKKFVRIKSQRKKNAKAFCSYSCSRTYYNAHKTYGCQRSKLEIYLESKLKILYPTLEIHYNRRDTINAELDFYIPSLKLAFELNGIFHYEPIFGAKKLQQTQNNDKRKFQACLERGIDLCIVDSSRVKHFKENAAKPFLDIFKQIIDSKFVRSDGSAPSSID